MNLLYGDETYRILGACFEVYNEMGSGFLEAVYQECLAIEFSAQGIPFRAKTDLALSYKGRLLEQKYVPDFIVFDKIVLELKAAKELGPEYRTQLYNYPKATKFRLGFLVNFGHRPKLEYERAIL